jgi:hypothetical protein
MDVDVRAVPKTYINVLCAKICRFSPSMVTKQEQQQRTKIANQQQQKSASSDILGSHFSERAKVGRFP